MKGNYLQIQKADLSLSRTGGRLVTMRMLENILNKNHIEHVYDAHAECLHIPVDDKYDAARINSLLLYVGTYFTDTKSEQLKQETRAKRGRPKNTVFESATGMAMTARKFAKSAHIDVKKKCLSKSDIVKLGLLTKSKMEKAIGAGELTQVLVSKTWYIDRVELSEFLKKSWAN